MRVEVSRRMTNGKRSTIVVVVVYIVGYVMYVGIVVIILRRIRDVTLPGYTLYNNIIMQWSKGGNVLLIMCTEKNITNM